MVPRTTILYTSPYKSSNYYNYFAIQMLLCNLEPRGKIITTWRLKNYPFSDEELKNTISSRSFLTYIAFSLLFFRRSSHFRGRGPSKVTPLPLQLRPVRKLVYWYLVNWFSKSSCKLQRIIKGALETSSESRKSTLMKIIVLPFFFADASGVITPAATALKSAAIVKSAISIERATGGTPKEEQPSQQTTELIRAVNPLSIAPLSVFSLSSSQPGIVRYVPSTPLHYVAYNVL